MSAETNRVLAHRCINEIWNEGQLHVIDEIYSPNLFRHDHISMAGGYDLKSFKQRVVALRDALPDVQFVIQATVATDDYVVLRGVFRGTQQGTLMGIFPTQRHVSVAWMTFSRYVDGKIVEEWVNWDTLGMLRQMGVFPPVEPSRVWA